MLEFMAYSIIFNIHTRAVLDVASFLGAFLRLALAAPKMSCYTIDWIVYREMMQTRGNGVRKKLSLLMVEQLDTLAI